MTVGAMPPPPNFDKLMKVYRSTLKALDNNGIGHGPSFRRELWEFFKIRISDRTVVRYKMMPAPTPATLKKIERKKRKRVTGNLVRAVSNRSYNIPGITLEQLAKEFDISTSTVHRILAGHYDHKHLPSG